MKKITIQRRNGQEFIIKVDAEDFEALSQFNWYITSRGYAARKALNDIGKWSMVFMHRLIMNCPSDLYIDHINHDQLDNRKVNLRICKQWENMQNRRTKTSSKSGYRGVYVYPASKINPWAVVVSIQGKQKTLGYFDCPKKAALFYNQEIPKYNPDFYRLNVV